MNDQYIESLVCYIEWKRTERGIEKDDVLLTISVTEAPHSSLSSVIQLVNF